MQTTSFEAYVLGLLAVLERLPVPIAIAFDRECARVQGNRAFRRLMGLSAIENATVARLQSAAGGQPPLLRAARQGSDVVDVAVQFAREDGSAYDLIASAWPLHDADGRIQGSIGIFVDVTQSRQAERRAQQAASALAESEQRYRLITEAMPQFVWLDAPDGSAVYANRRWLEYTGLTEEQNAGFGWQSVVHPDDQKRLEAGRARTLKTGEPFEGECRYKGRDGKYRWFLFRSIPVRDERGDVTGWLGTATDIDKQKRAEAQQAFFALAGDLLGSTLDVQSTLKRIARLAIASLGTWCQIDIPDARGTLRVAAVAHEDPVKEALLMRLLDRSVYDGEAPLGPPAVMRSAEPQMLQRVDENAVKAVIPAGEHREIYARVGYAAGLMVPLRIRDRVLGVLGIACEDPSRLYTDFDLSTALELGRRGAIALENAQSFAREHRVSTTLQGALLPASLPSRRDVQFFSAYAAAASAQGEAVGGDWYDAFALDESRIAISMGDVAGHGVDAAVTMGTVRQAIRAAALGGHSPKEVLAQANRMVALEQRAAMITALSGILDCASGTFTVSVAGHPRPLIVDDAGALIQTHSVAPPLGEAFDAAHLSEETLSLPRRCAAIFYTDGLLEFNHDVMAAASRLERIARERAYLTQPQPAQAIIDAMLDAPQRDDIAVLVMRVTRD